MKLLMALLVPIALAPAAHAVDCIGTPDAVKMGEFGAQESYAILRMDGKDYRLGLPTEDAVKVRVSLAQTALAAGKQVRLRFWGLSTCDEASTQRAIPNSIQLLR